MPVALGTAEGKVVVDKLNFQGTTIEGLTLVFSKGALTAMTAKSWLYGLKALYDASSGGKDQFSYIDVGLNPEANFLDEHRPYCVDGAWRHHYRNG